jgi:hypothetical protein
MGLRDSSHNIISRTIYLTAWINQTGGSAAAPTPVMATVYSNAPEPVISEVYAETDATETPNGYVAVELYNPYSVPMILHNWQLGLVNRASSGGTYPNLVFTTTGASSVIAPGTSPNLELQALNDPRPIPVEPATFPETFSYSTATSVAPWIIIVPAHGYALLENYNGSPTGTQQAGDAPSRPASSGLPASGIYYGMYNGIAVTAPSAATPPNTCDVYVPGLQLVLAGATGITSPSASTGGELVLLRPRRIDGVYTSTGNSATPAVDEPLNVYNEGSPTLPNLYDLVPVDSYDFTGMNLIGLTSNTAYSYIRIKGAAPGTWFRQFFPGRYTTIPISPALTRQGGTLHEPEPSGGLGGLWSTPSGTPQFGVDVLPGTATLPGLSTYTNNFPPTQFYNLGINGTTNIQSHFPNPTIYPVVVESTGAQDNPTVAVTNSTNTPYSAPFGTFARNGDMLDIPFVGAYRISQITAANPFEPVNFVELNSMPMDLSFADAYAVVNGYATVDSPSTPTDQNLENVGRFCPMLARATPSASGNPDFYAWAQNLFSYLTVQSSSDTVFPNFDPNTNDVIQAYSPTPSTAPNVYKYPAATTGNPTANPPVAATPGPTVAFSADPTATDETSQGTIGVQGLININTASWKVLNMLPMVTKVEDASYIQDNESLAKAIVAWRTVHGPFTSIYGLNQVVDLHTTSAGTHGPAGFQNAEGYINLIAGGGTAGVSSLDGLLCPPDPLFPNATASSPNNVPATASPPGAPTFNVTATGLGEDYQTDFAVLNRISNLITTRSDTFTVYIEVQGWQNVGTANASPVITRRYAFIVDRTGVNADPTTRFLKTVVVPSN